MNIYHFSLLTRYLAQLSFFIFHTAKSTHRDHGVKVINDELNDLFYMINLYDTDFSLLFVFILSSRVGVFLCVCLLSIE